MERIGTTTNGAVNFRYYVHYVFPKGRKASKWTGGETIVIDHWDRKVVWRGKRVEDAFAQIDRLCRDGGPDRNGF